MSNVEIKYKLPEQIIRKHKAELDAVDWLSKSQHAVELGGRAFLFEVVKRDYEVVVRPGTARWAIELRNYAHSILPDRKPDPAELAEVLKARNATTDV